MVNSSRDSQGGVFVPSTSWPSNRGRWFLTILAICTLYPSGIAVGTTPRVWHIHDDLPLSRIDPLQAITVMRWYKACLFAFRSPLINPSLQYPVGAPIGNFSPLHLQALLYIPISCVFDDITTYNLLMNLGLFSSGIGTFALAYYLVNHRAAAVLGGLLAMMSSPIMGRASGHLELTYLAFFPLFVLSWMRFIDKPSRSKLWLAAVMYLLLVMSAAYFLVFSIFTALLYVLWQGIAAARHGDWRWLVSRLSWFTRFAILVGLGVAILFSGHLWAARNGYSMGRSRYEFEMFGAPIWGYFIPAFPYPISKYLPFDFYDAAKILNIGERKSYLGLVTVFLVYYAATRRVPFRYRSFWWANLAVLVIISLGAICILGPHRVELPAGWLWKVFRPFQLIRVPARINAFVAVCTACIAAAALAEIFGRLRYQGMMVFLYLSLILFTFYDLCMVNIPPSSVPSIPPCYAFIKASDPQATLLEIPQVYPTIGASLTMTTDCAYWQATHGLPTSAGYSGQSNIRWDELVGYPSPFLETRLILPGYPENPQGGFFLDIVGQFSFRDYTWLYLTTHGFRHVVLHHGLDYRDKFPPQHFEGIKAQLEDTKIFEDERTVVYERAKLPAPTKPVLMCTTGWHARVVWRDRIAAFCGKTADVLLYNPTPDQDLQLVLEAAGVRQPRRVKLRAGGRILTEWDASADVLTAHLSPKFRLPAGLSTLTMESDGEVTIDTDGLPPPIGGDKRPMSLRVTTIRFEPLGPARP